MLKRISMFLFYIFLFFFFLYLFFPKENAFYALQNKLESYDVVITPQQILNKPLWLETDDTKLYYKKIAVADISKIDFYLYGFYNTIVIEKINLSKLSENFLPRKIDFLKFHYSVLNPIKIEGICQGDFGSAKFSLDIRKKIFTIRVQPSKRMLKEHKSSLVEFKKVNGEYLYEQTL